MYADSKFEDRENVSKNFFQNSDSFTESSRGVNTQFTFKCTTHTNTITIKNQPDELELDELALALVVDVELDAVPIATVRSARSLAARAAACDCADQTRALPVPLACA